MNQRSYPVPQMEPPLSPRETLPTMADLPSEDPEESGLPDEFHDLQPQLLSATLRLSGYSRDQIFTGTDLNLYYDVRRPHSASVMLDAGIVWIILCSCTL